MKKKERRRRKEGEEEDEKGDEPPLNVFARFATALAPSFFRANIQRLVRPEATALARNYRLLWGQ